MIKLVARVTLFMCLVLTTRAYAQDEGIEIQGEDYDLIIDEVDSPEMIADHIDETFENGDDARVVVVLKDAPVVDEVLEEKHRRGPKKAGFRTLIGDMGGVFREVFRKDNIAFILVASAISAGSFAVDMEVRDYFMENQPIDDIDDPANDWIGEGYVHIPLALGTYAIGKLSKNEKLAVTSMAGITAWLNAGIVSNVLKYVTSRSRPTVKFDGDPVNESTTAFPSGHVAVTFALATAYAHAYDWHPLIAIPAMGTAIWVSASRIQADAHWFSDVVVAGAIGIGFGILAVNHYFGKYLPENVEFIPYASDDIMGAGLRWRF